MTKYADLFNLSENERIKAIGATAEHGHVVAFIVEDDEKADRYMKKMIEQGFAVQEVGRFKGPVDGTITVKVGPRGH